MEQGKQIDLKSRRAGKSKPDGWVSFTTQSLSEKNLDELAAFAGLLEKVGVSLEISRKESKGAGLEYDFIVLKVNEEQYKKAITRHAGRKADFNKKYDKYGKCTVAELEEKLNTMPKTKIAAELGCSRMTLYRILKNIELQHPAKDTSIWHYTS